ncbi:putative MobA-like protein [Methylophilaceae bacterium 11]|jgi:molybdenum cofactor cytidylyltransferase|uniref:nucleotidyltransferase family protein n=1 Tax=Methylotenera sp. N17 TaxID=1502761 RepID=UPI000452CA6C|nr:nucleotidyltransferase family protein [Methylotenera sp. N17]EUJ11566.1 putative MobA-like protein [Methylophilaceae bacterium 11]
MVGILLAAGFSRRFGTQDKLLQCLPDGRPIALAAAQSLVSAVPVSVAVVREDNHALKALLSAAGLVVIACPQEAQVMADSLSFAVRYASQLTAAQDGFVIALADMPYIAATSIKQVITTMQEGAAIVVPTYHGQRGHPVGFSAKFADALTHLQGDQGARAIIQQHQDEVYLLACDDAGVLSDIDTPADLESER